MKKWINLPLIVCLFFFLASCVSSSWQISIMEISEDRESLKWDEFDGEIPVELMNWNIIADVSNDWFACDYASILRYSTLSIDEENRIWIYGPDQWMGSNRERVPDAPNCNEEIRPRIILYDQSSQRVEIIRVNLSDGSFLSSARGWSHIGGKRVLLTSVFIYHGPWDGPDGGIGNQYIDFAILEDGNLRDLHGGNSGAFAVPDYAISNNLLYAISSVYSNEIRILDLETEEWIDVIQPPNCDEIASIEVGSENIFLMCRGKGSSLILRIYSKDLHEIDSWVVIGDVLDFPLAVDALGRVWVGDKFVLKLDDREWVLEGIAPQQNAFIAKETQTYRRTIFGMFPYENKMLFSLEGAIYLANYDQKQWMNLVHRAPPLPMAVGVDGTIYAFTGRYIIANKP